MSGRILLELFRANLVDLRQKLGISPAELAKRARIDKGHLSRLESGQRVPMLETLESLAAGLDVEPYILLMPAAEREAIHPFPEAQLLYYFRRLPAPLQEHQIRTLQDLVASLQRQ